MIFAVYKISLPYILMSKASGVYDEEKVGEAKEVLYSLIQVKPRTFSHFKDPKYEGSPLAHTHLLGLCVQKLREEGRVAKREIMYEDGRRDTEFYAIERLVDEIKHKVLQFGRNIKDSFVSLYRKGWVEEKSEGISFKYSPGHFSTYLASCSLRRSSGKESGWDVAYRERSDHSRMHGTLDTVSGDVTMELDVINSRGDGPWYDQVSFSATFRRAKKRKMRIITSKQEKYVKKIFDRLSEIGMRSQVTELYSDRIIAASGKEDGSVDTDRMNNIIDEIGTLCPDTYWKVTEPLLRDYYVPKVKKKSDLDRHDELVDYLRKRTAEKSSRMGK